MPDSPMAVRAGWRWLVPLLIAVSLLFPLASGAAAEGASSIAWQPGGSDADIDRAFALARDSGKPVFLYWGAIWCPPCNQVKATLFPRADFIERSRAFVPVYVDGDKPGAQRVAARFHVQGYPTMVLFKPDGTELTRLPGEVDPERYLLALSAALEAQVPVRDLVHRALAGEPLTRAQWRLLALYSWETDQAQVLPDKELAKGLAQLASRAPSDPPQIKDRLALKAVAVSSDMAPGDRPAVPGARAAVDRLLEARSAGFQTDILTGYAREIVSVLAPSGAAQRELASRWDGALARLIASDRAVSNGTRIDALDARVSLWKLTGGTITPAQRKQVVVAVARTVAATGDRYERQAVVPSAAHVLSEAGLIGESDELLKMELPHAVAPYYHMLGLAANAKARGDNALALHWYEEAWRHAQGPATRLQWGVNYVDSLMTLAPNDGERIARAAQAVLGELQPRTETFYERNERVLGRLLKTLLGWQGEDPARRKIAVAIRQQLAATCGRLPEHDPGRANCAALLRTA